MRLHITIDDSTVCGIRKLHESDDSSEEEKKVDIDLELVFRTSPCWCSHEINTHNSQIFFENLVGSPYFQERAKQIRSISFKYFQLDDWEPFLEALAQNQPKPEEEEEPKLVALSFQSCYFTQQGADVLAWALDNEKSGIHLDCFNISKPTGSGAWIAGLHKNTFITKITTEELDCGIAFLNFIRQCNRKKFHYIHYHGLLEKNGNQNNDQRRRDEGRDPLNEALRHLPDDDDSDDEELLYEGDSDDDPNEINYRYGAGRNRELDEDDDDEDEIEDLIPRHHDGDDEDFRDYADDFNDHDDHEDFNRDDHDFYDDNDNDDDEELSRTRFESSQYFLRIQLCHHCHEHVRDEDSDDFPVCIVMGYSWGILFVNIGRNFLHRDEPGSHLRSYWEKFQDLLSFPGETPEALGIRLKSEGKEILREALTDRKVPVTLDLMGYLSQESAQALGWVLDTETSGVDIRNLNFDYVEGSYAWVSGLLKNTSIESLHLNGMHFLQGALHFLQHGKAYKLETFEFYNLQQGEDETLDALLEKTNVSSSSEVDKSNTKSLISPKNIRFGFFSELETDNSEMYCEQLPTSICKTIGNVLRRSSKLSALKIRGIKTNPEYDFMKDVGESCDNFCLDNTEFDPDYMASLVNGGRVRQLWLEWKVDENGWENGVTLLNQIDLTSLAHLNTGHCLTEHSLSALCQQFRQNKGPRVLTINLVKSKAGRRGLWSFFQRPIELFNDGHLLRLGESLARNTKIEAIRLAVESDVHPSVMLAFLQSICKMPSLRLMGVTAWEVWNKGPWMAPQIEDEDDEEEHEEEQQRIQEIHDSFHRCQQLIMKQVLERNLWIDLFSWMGDDEQFPVALKVLEECKQMLSRDANDLPDGIWAQVLGYVAVPEMELTDVLFCLVRELPRLFQNIPQVEKEKEEGSHFPVNHHPDCPGCHKRQKVDV